jgi:hypothetical protein
MSFMTTAIRRFCPSQLLVVTSIISVGMTLFAVRFVAPGQVHAQPEQQGEIRATAFTLVGQDGTVIGRFGPWGLPDQPRATAA